MLIVFTILGVIDAEQTRQRNERIARLIDICLQDPIHHDIVEDFHRYLPWPRLWNAYVTHEGDVYQTNDRWELTNNTNYYVHHVTPPEDGLNHYCWALN